MIVYLARDIPAFVMYCVNEESGSSLLIESTDSMTSIQGGITVYACDRICKTCQISPLFGNQLLIYVTEFEKRALWREK